MEEREPDEDTDVRAATPSAAAELVVPEREALLYECDRLLGRLRRAGEAALSQKSAALSTLQRRLAEQAPEKRLLAAAERVRSLWARLDLLATARLTAMRHGVSELTLRLNAASPEATLKRGYAMVTQRGRLVPAAAELDMQLTFTVTLRDGKVVAQALPLAKEETP